MHAQHNGHLAALWGMTVSADQKNGLILPLPVAMRIQQMVSCQH